ncbi:MerR family transcriptional regulator [Corynebacterium callunae]|uniref:MerR family transcriptional regulator n=1 Tax=Corynebacterium callunae TaxID=1721 RepID=UPI0039823767
MTDRTIGEAADLLGVTTRTLRHWDHIGLLSPQWRSGTDYRLYTEAELQKGLQILVYRAAGLPLKEIAELLVQPETAQEHLRRQRDLLQNQISQLHRMVRAVDEILEKERVSVSEQVEIFGEDLPKYQQEAYERWGDTPEWEHSQRVQKSMSKADMQAAKDSHDGFIKMLVDAATAGIKPGSEAANKLVRTHRDLIGQWYPVSANKQVILARMYVEDERFNQTYQGHAAYLLSLVEALAQSEGVDLTAVKWG